MLRSVYVKVGRSEEEHREKVLREFFEKNFRTGFKKNSTFYEKLLKECFQKNMNFKRTNS